MPVSSRARPPEVTGWTDGRTELALGTAAKEAAARASLDYEGRETWLVGEGERETWLV